MPPKLIGVAIGRGIRYQVKKQTSDKNITEVIQLDHKLKNINKMNDRDNKSSQNKNKHKPTTIINR